MNLTRHSLAPLALPVVALGLFGLGAWLGSGRGDGFFDKAKRLCDQEVVALLLHSKDVVEVLRAGIIAYQVDCGIYPALERGAEMSEPTLGHGAVHDAAAAALKESEAPGVDTVDPGPGRVEPLRQARIEGFKLTSPILRRE